MKEEKHEAKAIIIDGYDITTKKINDVTEDQAKKVKIETRQDQRETDKARKRHFMYMLTNKIKIQFTRNPSSRTYSCLDRLDFSKSQKLDQDQQDCRR